ncbi:MAG: hypothetical protein ACM3UT_05760 [Chloroflexota bacterium]
MKDIKHYADMARLFKYPTEQLKNDVDSCGDFLAEYDESLEKKLEPFRQHVMEKTLAYQQEYYSETFDVQPVSTLDIGYVLFGDDYRRGVFLVNMQREHIMAGNDCGRELPDHLPNVLTLLPMISDKGFAEELICSLLIPALTEMIRRFRGAENYYRSLLEILLSVMESDFNSSSYERYQFTLKTPVQ